MIIEYIPIVSVKVMVTTVVWYSPRSSLILRQWWIGSAINFCAHQNNNRSLQANHSLLVILIISSSYMWVGEWLRLRELPLIELPVRQEVKTPDHRCSPQNFFFFYFFYVHSGSLFNVVHQQNVSDNHEVQSFISRTIITLSAQWLRGTCLFRM